MTASTRRLLRCPCSYYDQGPKAAYATVFTARSQVPERPSRALLPVRGSEQTDAGIAKPSDRISIGFFSGLNVNSLPRVRFRSPAVTFLVLIRLELSSIRSQTRRTVLYVAYFSRGNRVAFKASEINAHSSTRTGTSQDAYTKIYAFLIQ
jgi:hypothetical protein